MVELYFRKYDRISMITNEENSFMPAALESGWILIDSEKGGIAFSDDLIEDIRSANITVMDEGMCTCG